MELRQDLFQKNDGEFTEFIVAHQQLLIRCGREQPAELNRLLRSGARTRDLGLIRPTL